MVVISAYRGWNDTTFDRNPLPLCRTFTEISGVSEVPGCPRRGAWPAGPQGQGGYPLSRYHSSDNRQEQKPGNASGDDDGTKNYDPPSPNVERRRKALRPDRHFSPEDPVTSHHNQECAEQMTPLELHRQPSIRGRSNGESISPSTTPRFFARPIGGFIRGIGCERVPDLLRTTSA